MLQEMSKQEYVETTMMDQSNLAMVFAPAFLKCPHTDYSKVHHHHLDTFHHVHHLTSDTSSGHDRRGQRESLHRLSDGQHTQPRVRVQWVLRHSEQPQGRPSHTF